MSNEPFYEKRDGEWVKVVYDLEGNEHAVGISEAERIQLEAEKEGKKVKSVSQIELKGIIKEALAETGIQENKDAITLKEARLGGGVVQLERKNVNPNMNETIPYKDVHDELDRLRALEDRGGKSGKDAKRQLDSLFEIMGKQMLTETGRGMVLIACPRCSRPIETLSTSTCPFCGFSLVESGYTKYADLKGGLR